MSPEACRAEDYDPESEHFGRRQYDMQLQKAQTEIAVLNIKVSNLEDKIDEVRKEIGLLRDHIDRSNESMQMLISEMRKASAEAHKDIARKVSDLEKWRYMLIGAGIILGSLGFEAVKTLFSM